MAGRSHGPSRRARCWSTRLAILILAALALLTLILVAALTLLALLTGLLALLTRLLALLAALLPLALALILLSLALPVGLIVLVHKVLRFFVEDCVFAPFAKTAKRPNRSRPAFVKGEGNF